MKVSHVVIIIAGLMAIASTETFGTDWSTPAPLASVNSQYSEGWPTISDDGLTLYFVRSGTPASYYNQMYQATRATTADSFGNAAAVSSLAYEGHVDNPWISSDSLRMYYWRTEPDGGSGSWRIKENVRATATSGWGTAQDLTSINNLGKVGNPKLAADELSIVFDVFNGDYGIMYAGSRGSTSQSFGNFRALGELNVADARVDFLSKDGLTLYYSRNDSGTWHVYESARASLAGTFGAAMKMNFPDNYGLGCFSADGQTAYLGFNGDIYTSQIPEPATMGLVAVGALMLRKRNWKRR